MFSSSTLPWTTGKLDREQSECVNLKIYCICGKENKSIWGGERLLNGCKCGRVDEHLLKDFDSALIKYYKWLRGDGVVSVTQSSLNVQQHTCNL